MSNVNNTNMSNEEVNNSEFSKEKNVLIDSVLRILDEGIAKLKVSLVIPNILKSPNVLKQYMGSLQYEKCLKFCQDYREAKILEKSTERCSSSSSSPSLSFSLDYGLVKLIDLFHQNHKITEHLPDYLTSSESRDAVLIQILTDLRQISEQRLRKSAISELAKERQVYQVFHENNKIKNAIEELKIELHNQEINLQWKLSAKQALIKKYEEDLAAKKWDNNIKLKQEIMKSKDRMRDINMQSKVKQASMSEELEKAKNTFAAIVKTNLKAEKESRDEKNKLLLQLQGLIKKYDQNISDKHRENTQTQELFNEVNKELDEFMVEFNLVEEEYERLVVTKLREEKQAQEEKMLLFMMNRAARIIQRCWRKYIKHKKKKDKLVGGKGKRKGKSKN